MEEVLEEVKKICLSFKQKQVKEVTCLSCKQKITIELIKFGNGHIATCPKCDHLAYSGE